MSGRWTPEIGDPTPVGWITVIAYLLAAMACAVAASHATGARRGAAWWKGFALLMLALGINKQLDLQTLLTQLLRDSARHDGWYEQRKSLQASFILVMAVGGAMGITVLWRTAAVLQRNIRLALAGLIFLFTYVVIRAASFHHVDIFIGTRLFGMKWNWIIELSGIVIVFAAALREGRVGRRESR